LREDIHTFREAGAMVAAIGPHTVAEVQEFTHDNEYPFPLLADAEHAVFDAYDVLSRAMSLGQRPAVFVIDRDGIVRFDSIGTQQWQIPSDKAVLDVVRALSA
jgi:peroxiredoxin